MKLKTFKSDKKAVKIFPSITVAKILSEILAIFCWKPSLISSLKCVFFTIVSSNNDLKHCKISGNCSRYKIWIAPKLPDT